MLRLLIDQDLDHDILRGLIRRVPQIDAQTVFDIGQSKASDPEILSHAAEDGRVVITHDRRTMPAHAMDLVAAGKDVGGLIVVPRNLPLHQVIEDLELIVTCSENSDWTNVILYLPL